MEFKTLLDGLRDGRFDAALGQVYAPEGAGPALDAARARAVHVTEGLGDHFTPGDGARAGLFSAPGRTELGGNHTDHQHGRVLCGSVDMDMLCCAAENGLWEIRVLSEGYPALAVSLEDLAPRQEEYGTTAALVRGMVAGVTAQGRAVRGFDAYVVSGVPAGSGLSSSAAFEVLVGTILNRFFCDDSLDAVEIAKLGQRAENEFFGKPCGLMDQIGAAVGGAAAVDFADPASPIVRRLDYDFSASGHALCIIDTGSDHADLTEDYADIPREMGAVAAHFGKSVLREVPEEQVRENIPALRAECGDRAVLRALHFYAEDQRAAAEAEALEAEDFALFLALVNASGVSSAMNLQNIWSPHAPGKQAVSLCLALARELLGGAGAVRVHGGGFAGTIQAFVPTDRLDGFKAGMEAVVGQGKCHVLRIRPQGGCVVVA